MLAAGRALLGQFAKRDREVACGTLQTVGAGFQFFDAVLRLDGDGGERRFDLHVQSLGGRLGLLLGAR